MEMIGKVNLYTCKACSHSIGTINMNTGVTPFCIRCVNCDDSLGATSAFYRQGAATIEKAWYRPTPEAMVSLERNIIEHVLMGGMLLGELREIENMKESEQETREMLSDDFEWWIAYVELKFGIGDGPVWQEVKNRLLSTEG